MLLLVFIQKLLFAAKKRNQVANNFPTSYQKFILQGACIMFFMKD